MELNTSCLLAWALLQELKSVHTRHFVPVFLSPLADAMLESSSIHELCPSLRHQLTRAVYIYALVHFRGGDSG